MTPSQLRLLHVARKRLALADDDWRALLLRAGGVESSRDLDRLGFEAVMDELRRLGFESDFHRGHLGGRFGMASAAQHALIADLWSEITDGTGTEAALGKWLERFGVSSLRFLPADKAPKVIAALLSWKGRKADRARRAAAG